jgi:hypothetical protein
MDEITKNALEIGRKRAEEVLALRARALQLRGRSFGEAAITTAGVLVAEGDSWFDYPLNNVIKELEDRHGYDVESVAHRGDPIEEMAYGSGQLDELTRRIEKLLRRGVTPKAVLLSGGGNDVAGTEFGMLLNHAKSPISGFNSSIVEGVINQRVRTAYIAILSAVTSVCSQTVGKVIPILVHGYDYPVPDGRGFLGGWGFLPGPWLEPGFREKGYNDMPRRVKLAHDLIERFNIMLKDLAGLEPFVHVHYIDLRNTLPTGAKYKEWWANELHPTEQGFRTITEKFAAKLAGLS